MTVYYVDDGGSNTSPFDTWAKAAPTLAALQTSIAGSTGTGGNVIYIGADSVSSGDGATVTFTGPTTGGVCTIISATVGTTTYAKSATDQVSSTGVQTWTNNFALYGVQTKATDNIVFANATSTSAAQSLWYTEDCTVKIGSNRVWQPATTGSTQVSRQLHRRITVNATGDAGAQSAAFISPQHGYIEIVGATFVDSASHRTGAAVAAGAGLLATTRISGMDCSNLSGIAAVVNQSGNMGTVELHNCKTAASPTWTSNATNSPGRVLVTNSGSADSPEFLYFQSYEGTVSSDTTNYRNSGASIETIPVSWKMVSTANCGPSFPLITPWIYGTISVTGSKTFDIYMTQDGGAGDLTDADVWMELEYLGTSSVALCTWTNDRCSISGLFSAAAAQTDDVTSTWAGTITETYMQKLSVTATVNEEGLYRARVVLGKASTTVYVDPMVTVS